MAGAERTAGETRRGAVVEVFLAFLRLGTTSFGGPVAHLGYFQKELVERREWCSQATFAEIVALAQSLPGPASSQTGFAMGILRAGWAGGLAAWVGFTAPSAMLMLALAYGSGISAGRTGQSVMHGLQLIAVAVVAQAVLSMQRTLAPDRVRMMLAIVAAAIVLFVPFGFASLLAIALGALAGVLLVRRGDQSEAEPIAAPLPKAAGVVAAVLFLAILAWSCLTPVGRGPSALAVFAAFYRSGALVFGGGHVVLPLLEGTVVRPGWVPQLAFLSGYGAAQALPGPLFTFAAYLGASIRPAPSGLLFGLVALMGLFLPGLLAVVAVLPFWSAFRLNGKIGVALNGMNAAVVGILIAALYTPLWTGTVHSPNDFLFALAAFVLLALWKLPSWQVVALGALISFVQSYF